MRGKRESMSDPQAPRRRKSSPSSSRSSAGGTGGGGPLPMAALIVGIIVAGLGIGALVSAFQNRETSNVPELGATSLPAITPVPQISGPRPVITLPPTPSPSPIPTPSPAPSPSASASATPPAKPSAQPSATPSALAGASALPSA